jgi:hypothetical protein
VKKFLAMLVMFAVLLSSVGCGGSATSPTKDKDKPADNKDKDKDKKDKDK